MPKSKRSDPIDDMLKWEKKQYTPWEYAQEGKLPLPLKARGNKKWATILFLAQGLVCLLLFGLMIRNGSDLVELVILFAYTILCFMIAANYMKKWKAAKLAGKKTRPHKRRNFQNQNKG
ncbi:MAG: hypothetical protein AB7D36_00600 [Oscillospiraceae bacterium]